MRQEDIGFLESEFGKISDTEFFRTAAARVRHFNFVARNGHMFNDQDIARQRSFVKEELLVELLKDGISDKSRLLTIDAICDVFVVATYWDFLTVVQTLVNDNVGTEERCLRYAIGETNDNLHVGLAGTYSLTDHVEAMVSAYNGDRTGSLVRSCVAFMQIAGFDHQKALNEVLDSNDSKLPTLEAFLAAVPEDSRDDIQLAMEQESKRIELNNDGRYTGVSGSVFDGRVVFRDDKGKIMKPITFFEPDLARL